MSVFEPYLVAQRERSLREVAANEVAAQGAMTIARSLARLLGDQFGARRVVLTGSLARGTFAQGSDIDLAAEGISAGDFYRAGAELEAEAKGLSVDLVPIESASTAYLEALSRDGVELS